MAYRLATDELSDAGLSNEQRVGEASPDTIVFKPVAARSLFVSITINPRLPVSVWSFNSYTPYNGSPCYLDNQIAISVEGMSKGASHFLIFTSRL